MSTRKKRMEWKRPSLAAFLAGATLALGVGGAQAVTITGPSSSATPYLTPVDPRNTVVSIMTVGDSVNLKPDGVTPYRAVGLMDGLGAYDNGNGTFTLLMNHEVAINVNASTGVATAAGVTRAHGNAGSFVSQWTIDKSTLAVIKIEDFLPNNTSIFLSNNVPGTSVHTGFTAGTTTAISRLCSADLAAATAYGWTDSNGTFFGTDARLFQTGEESGGVATSISNAGGNLGENPTHFGRQWVMVATDDSRIAGNQARTAFEMPHCGLFAWENNLANPLAQRKTITAGMDDGSPIGQVYFWVGEKQTTGNVVERAGLTLKSANDALYVLKVPSLLTVDGSGVPLEDRSAPVSGAFQLVRSGNNGDASGLTFNQLEADSDSKGATQFLRPEDGQWDPRNPSNYYFLTTDRYDEFKDNTDGLPNEADGSNDNIVDQVGRSRLYRLSFTDIANPELGGTIEALLDGTEAGNMYDNMTIDEFGRIILQEDPGNQNHNAKVWVYDIASDSLSLLLEHDSTRFGDLGLAANAPFTLDEESSGVIDVSHILGQGWFLGTVQAHYGIAGELVEGGQLVAFQIATPEPGTLTLLGFAGLGLLRRRRNA